MRILTFGSLNYDYVYSVDHIVQPGETISSERMETFCGGKGLNQSISLSRAGAQVELAGMVGEDGDALLEVCKKNKIGCSNVQKLPGRSGHTIIQVNKNGQNCILLYGGSNQKNTKENVDAVLAQFEKGDMILLQNEINCLDYIIEKAYEKGMKIILNPSPMDDIILNGPMDKVSLFLMNEIEGEQITGESDPDKILEKMHQMYPNGEVLLTLGKLGVVYQDKNLNRYRHGIYKVKVVDTVAAGDTFTGFFISSILNGESIPEALRLASIASSLAVSVKGATNSIPTIEMVKSANLELQ